MNGGLSMVEMKSGYKMTEVGVIPEDWEVKTLGKLACINGRIGFRGYTVKDLVRKGEGAIAIGGKHISKNFLDLSDAEYISWKKYYESPEIMVRQGDIVLAQRGTLGKSALIKSDIGPATINPSLVLINKIKCNNLYLIYNIQSSSVTDYIQQINAQTSIPMISQKQIEGIKIAIAKLDSEQTAIATALSDVDSLISALTKKIEKKKAIKQGLMQQLLTGKKRLPGFGGVWDVVQLKRIISEFIVPMRDKPTALTGPIPWCRIEDFDGKYLKKSLSNQGVDLNTVSKMNLKIFPVNTLLVSCSANLGRCAIVKQKLVTNQTFIGLVPSDRIDVEFLYYKMSREDKNLNSMATGTTISYLSREQFENYEILIPSSKAEQTAIANILSDCDSEIAALEEKRDKYKEIKQGMMQQLLTGKIRLIK